MRLRYRLMGGTLVAFMLAVGLAGAAAGDGASAAKTEAAAVSSKLSKDLLRPESKLRVLTRDVRLAVGKGATIQPTFTSNLPVGNRGAKVPVQTVELDSGRVDAFLPTAPLPRGVLLQGPDKVLAISTTGHMVMKVEEKRILIAAVEGDVLVGQDSKFKPLEEGKMRTISRVTGLAEDAPLLGRPTLENKVGLSVALTGSVQVPLNTNAETPLLLAVVDEFGTPIISPRRVERGAPLSVTVPHAGVYYAVARSLGEGDIEGPLSEPVKIQVLGLAPGQRPPQDGLFLLSRGERVHLSGTDGLEVRYGNSPTYVPASNSVGLSQHRKTLVEFRNPLQQDQKATLTLAPRFMKKVIEMGPSEARWPGDPVKMRVGLWDGAGRLLEPGKDVDVRVTVNSSKVPVTWRTTGGGYIGHIPKQGGDGPWVVRVNVLDERGHTIARDFLEVASR